MPASMEQASVLFIVSKERRESSRRSKNKVTSVKKESLCLKYNLRSDIGCLQKLEQFKSRRLYEQKISGKQDRLGEPSKIKALPQTICQET